MKRVVIASIGFLFLGVLVVSTSTGMMRRLLEYRMSTSNPILKSYKEYYGILYGFSFLPDFRLKLTEKTLVKVNKKNIPRTSSLYAICDSQLWKFIKSDTLFDGVNHYDFSRWNDWSQHDTVTLDSSTTNILLIEIDERKLRLLKDTAFVLEKLIVKKGSKFAKSSGFIEQSDFWSSLFNKNIESNLEFNLFDYQWFLPLKECKAFLNYTFFDRIDKDVELSKDRKFLFSKETTDTSQGTSSFNPISDIEIERIVHSINYVASTYRQNGMDKVYFSFVPNSVTINDPMRGVHNHLIPRIQNHPSLQASYIDVLEDFRKSNLTLYYTSDTHWNYTGFSIWLNKVNLNLDTLCAKKR